MAKDKKVKRCKGVGFRCGAFASSDGYCDKCRRIFELEAQIGKCQLKNRDLDQMNKSMNSELDKLKERQKFPMFLHIKEKNWNLTRDRLREFITAIEPVSDMLQIEYGFND